MPLRPAAAILLALASALLSACRPPGSAVVVDCIQPFQMQHNPWKACTLRVEAFDGPGAAVSRSTAPSYYRYFEMEGDFSVARGRVR